MNGTSRSAVDRRLLRYAGAARAHLVLAVALGLAGTGLILAQTGLLARALAVAARGDTAASLSGTLAALRQAAQEGVPFACVLLDAHMPAMDGFTVAAQIK